MGLCLALRYRSRSYSIDIKRLAGRGLPGQGFYIGLLPAREPDRIDGRTCARTGGTSPGTAEAVETPPRPLKRFITA
jgi:hypothetical protein